MIAEYFPRSDRDQVLIEASPSDHSPDTMKFSDNSLTMRGTHAHVKWYS